MPPKQNETERFDLGLSFDREELTGSTGFKWTEEAFQEFCESCNEMRAVSKLIEHAATAFYEIAKEWAEEKQLEEDDEQDS